MSFATLRKIKNKAEDSLWGVARLEMQLPPRLQQHAKYLPRTRLKFSVARPCLHLLLAALLLVLHARGLDLATYSAFCGQELASAGFASYTAQPTLNCNCQLSKATGSTCLECDRLHAFPRLSLFSVDKHRDSVL